MNQEMKQADVPIIPREVLFGNPDKASPQLSPDGSGLAFLAPLDGVLNVWVGPADDPESAKPVTRDRVRGIRIFFWAHTNEHVIYLQDKAGDENWRVYAVDLATTEAKLRRIAEDFELTTFAAYLLESHPVLEVE